MGELTSEDKLLNVLREKKEPREVARVLNPWSENEQPPAIGSFDEQGNNAFHLAAAYTNNRLTILQGLVKRHCVNNHIASSDNKNVKLKTAGFLNTKNKAGETVLDIVEKNGEPNDRAAKYLKNLDAKNAKEIDAAVKATSVEKDSNINPTSAPSPQLTSKSTPTYINLGFMQVQAKYIYAFVALAVVGTLAGLSIEGICDPLWQAMGFMNGSSNDAGASSTVLHAFSGASEGASSAVEVASRSMAAPCRVA